ncbi:MAG: TonB-dependent receptor plug domain-containing protein [Telluria sp.]
MPIPTRLALLAAIACCVPAARAQAPAQPPLADFSLEQLSEIVVTSVSRQESRLADAPTSIFRITSAAIRRSGATTLPEALRLAPNLSVARADAHTWAITARGFASTLENKLLVLIDGRSVYSPLFSGVFWDMQDVMLEDIERIEVISGPGATIWGANAVNGVINIITKSARDTQGSLASFTAGNDEHGAAARHGGQLGAAGWWRLYAKYADADSLTSENGQGARNGWRRRQAGLRTDFDAAGYAWTVSSDAYAGSFAQARNADLRTGGANVLARAMRKLGDGSDVRVQAYLDHVERSQPGTAAQKLDTFDLEAQHDWRPNAAHTVAWGAGYRYAHDHLTNGPGLQFLPAEAPLRWVNVFVQDEVRLRPDLRLVAGTKAEQTNYTGWEWLPSLRLAWNVDSNRTLWAAATRSVRAPSRIDRDLYIVTPGQPANRPHYLVEGGPLFESESARVLELGWRDQPSEGLTYSVTLFASAYDKLRTLEPQPGHGSTFRNMGEGSTSGIEAWGRWQLTPRWRLSGGFTAQHLGTSLKPGSLDTSGALGLASNDPAHSWSLRSLWDVSEHVTFDLFYRRVGSLPRPAVPGYGALDARLGWELRPGLEFSLTARDLLEGGHVEWGSAGTRMVVDRSLLANLVWRF